QANASAKKTAAQNEVTIRNLKVGMVIANMLYFLLRFILPNRSFPPTMRQLTLYFMTGIPEFVLFRHLSSVGLPRRDPTTGTLIAAGEDLSQQGVTEWCFDVIYVTWACQVGSSLIGDYVWWLYLSIPLYAAYKIYVSFLAPFLRMNSPSQAGAASPNGPANGDSKDTELLSKKQQKMQKKAEKRGGADPSPQARIKGRR
ncbi:hypothetical protein BS47DRAFT_1300755, partial [Hydnum rufescens UP504]